MYKWIKSFTKHFHHNSVIKFKGQVYFMKEVREYIEIKKQGVLELQIKETEEKLGAAFPNQYRILLNQLIMLKQGNGYYIRLKIIEM